jgi:hypothetical protein
VSLFKLIILPLNWLLDAQSRYLSRRYYGCKDGIDNLTRWYDRQAEKAAMVIAQRQGKRKRIDVRV